MKAKLSTAFLLCSSFVLIIAFQNCSKVGFTESQIASLKNTGDGRNPGDDPLGVNGRDPGDDPDADERDPGDDEGEQDPRDPGDDEGVNSIDEDEDSDWLYIPGGRGHVPMSSVAICPVGSKDEGKQKCPMFCYKGVDYVMHKSEARNYFVKKFDEVPNYGGGAVPGTCANPDLKIKD
ncbi:hypothetical protein [Bdellovibrio sp. HCB2-146]|uniref:hypothetical protein n=1 Tax=Bdellovibrio sp. HCB2-146 TaxID=3394362 RepID=UPI0039BC413C